MRGEKMAQMEAKRDNISPRCSLLSGQYRMKEIIDFSHIINIIIPEYTIYSIQL